MPVEFISLINVWESSELHPHPGGAPDAAYIKKYARSLDLLGLINSGLINGRRATAGGGPR